MMFIKRNNDNLKAIIDALNASLAVIEFSPDGIVLSANENFTKTVGYSENEIVGKHHRLFCDPKAANDAEYIKFWSDLSRGIYRAGEFKRFGKGGRLVWLQASYNPVKNNKGEVIKVIKFASDITAEKMRAIDFQGKIDAIDRAQAIIEFKPNGEIVTANQNFLSTVGYQLSEIVGKHHSMFCEPEYTKSAEYKEFWNDLYNGKFHSSEFKRIGKGGKVVYIQASYNPVRDDTGEIIKVVKFATDITPTVEHRARNENLSHSINSDLGSVLGEVDQAGEMAIRVSEASVETGAIVNSVAAASEELNQSVREISQNMTNARAGVETVFQYAENANKSADMLNQTAASMNNIVTIIHEIAQQINLLALNATIESARAGEAGRGFAVVASEVKNLANQTTASTETISSEIEKMQNISSEVVDALSVISNSMNSVLDNVAAVASAIDEQNSVTTDISQNMQHAVGAVNDITNSIQEINSTFEKVTNASEKVKRDVEALVS